MRPSFPVRPGELLEELPRCVQDRARIYSEVGGDSGDVLEDGVSAG